MADRVQATIQPQHLQSRFKVETPEEVCNSTSYPAADQTLDVSQYNHYYALPQLQQQYAFPLRSIQYDQTPVALSGDARQRTRNSEHLLRRKTPCETLTAAYDGSSVESSGDHHAMKRLLLPVTNANGDAKPDSGPIATHHQPQIDLNAARAHDMLRGHTGVWIPNGQKPIGYSTIPGQVKQGMSSFRSLYQSPVDSVMDPISPQFWPSCSQHDACQASKGMQLPFQIPPVPSVASDPANYWPSRGFIPYPPAASPDPRYIHSVDSAVNDFNQYSVLPRVPPKFSNSGYPVVDCPTESISPHQMNFVSERQPGGVDFAPCTYSVQVTPTNRIRNVLPVPPARYSSQRSTNGSKMPEVEGRTSIRRNNLSFRERQSFRTVARPSTDISTIASENVSYPDRVLSWARTVYANLLSAVQKTRRGSHVWRYPIDQSGPPRIEICAQRMRGTVPALHSFNNQYGRCTDITKPAHKCDNMKQKHSLSGTHAINSLQTDSVHLCQSRLEDIHQACNCTSVPRNTTCGLHQRLPSRLDLNGTTFAHNKDVDNWYRSCSAPRLPAQSCFAQKSDPRCDAMAALEALTKLCEVSGSIWIDGTLVAGCLSYLLGDYQQAIRWYFKILEQDENHVETMSNLAATLLALDRRQEAEYYWRSAVKLRPGYFEAVEHLIGLLCLDSRTREASEIIDHVQQSLRATGSSDASKKFDQDTQRPNSDGRSPTVPCVSGLATSAFYKLHHALDVEDDTYSADDCGGFSTPVSEIRLGRYSIPDEDNGRLMALLHTKANILYNHGDHLGAARTFEEVILVAVGQPTTAGIDSLIMRLIKIVSKSKQVSHHGGSSLYDSILLLPEQALQIAMLCFPPDGELPGLKFITNRRERKTAITTTSNSLLSLAKIFQDRMTLDVVNPSTSQPTYGVEDILLLYYLSLSLQPSPSTANNMGILLAGVQQAVPPRKLTLSNSIEELLFPGVAPGSGVALALTYYNYGLSLDSTHAHLFTNLGSLLKDIGQLQHAVKMYEKAVAYAPNFDIALANLANAVKDQGKIKVAISYYQRAVRVNPDFAEALCGLASALNSICCWIGRGGVIIEGAECDRWHVDDAGMLMDAKIPGCKGSGWMRRVIDIVDSQLAEGVTWGMGTLQHDYIHMISGQVAALNSSVEGERQQSRFLHEMIAKWSGQRWEGVRIVRFVERAIRQVGWQWYQDEHVKKNERQLSTYHRPQLPGVLSVPSAPSVLPFHTFTLPMTAKQIRLIAQRNGLRVSTATLQSAWLPHTVFSPPVPPNPHLNVGYLSSDFNNHPLAHLMQSVFGMHDASRVTAFCYATTASDNSVYRQQIEREATVFYDASNWSVQHLVEQIVHDGIHILVNLNGYTRGARNEIFVARPAPIQMSFMGFAGTLGAGWCDYLLADETAIPPKTLRPYRRNVDFTDLSLDETWSSSNDDWVYSENIIYTRHTFFCCDHRQSASPEERHITWPQELSRRWQIRKDLFPTLPPSTIILANFNQLYKIDPTTFRTWLRILSALPSAVLWLLRFPADGEQHLLATAHAWAGAAIASRILFTDVAPKSVHIQRACVADLFLDTAECNAHTTAADCLWSGTPMLTTKRWEWKMSSRMGAGILGGALPLEREEGWRAWRELAVGSEEEYEEVAVRLGKGLRYLKGGLEGGAGFEGEGEGGRGTGKEAEYEGRGEGRLMDLRKMIWENRWTCKLFDTRRWVRDLEDAYEEAWRRWVAGEGGDIWLKDIK